MGDIFPISDILVNNVRGKRGGNCNDCLTQDMLNMPGGVPSLNEEGRLYRNMLPKQLGGFRKRVTGTTFDWYKGTVFTKRLDNSEAFFFDNDSDPGTSISIVVQSTGNYSIAWPYYINWPGGVAPNQTPNGTDVYTFTSTEYGVFGSVLPNVVIPDVSAPYQITGTDIGGPAVQGGVSSWSISGAGSGIDGTSDQFFFAHAQVTGDEALKTYFTFIGDPDPNARVGLMFRNTLDADSPFVAVVSSYGNGAVVKWRSAPGGSTAVWQTDTAWTGYFADFRLKREGNTFSAYFSSGEVSNETPFGAPFITMNSAISPTAYAGLVIYSGSSNNGAGIAHGLEFEIRGGPTYL